MPTLESVTHDLQADREGGFLRWFGKPEIKLIISVLPPMETDQQKDCLRCLLESAYRTGHDAGQGAVATMMLQDIVKDRTGPPRR